MSADPASVRRLATVVLLLPLALSACGGSRTSSNSIPIVTTKPPTPASHTFTYNVPSASMEPTLHCAQPEPGCNAKISDGVVTQEPAANIKHGDIVAFHTPPLAAVRCGAGGIFIKRVIGMPGDRWEERNGYVYIDGKKLAEPYVPQGERDARTIAAVTIPPDRYFLMGDNRSSSCDSREWGTVPSQNLIGKVVKIIRTQ